MPNDLDEILGDKPEVIEDEKKPLDSEKQGFIDAIADERAKRRALEAELETIKAAKEAEVEPEPETVTDDAPSTADEWIGLIDKKSTDATKLVSEEVAKIKESQRKKAVNRFVESHPEYKDAARMSQLVEKYNRVKSRSDIDADDVYEDLQDAYAIDNRTDILKRDAELRSNQLETEQNTADIASSGGSSSERSVGVSDAGASPSDKRMAAQLGYSTEQYMKLKRQLADAELANV